MRRTSSLFSIFLSFALNACIAIPSRVDFTNDRRIFRGVFEAEDLLIEEKPVLLRVESTPTYVDERGYTIVGTVKLGDEPPVPFEGEVWSGHTHLYVLTEPTLPPTLEFTFSYGGEAWRIGGSLNGESANDIISWSVYIGPEAGLGSGPIYAALLEPAN